MHHALGEKADGQWSAFEVGLCVPRQNGKSAIIEARILAGLLLFDEELITYSAHEFRTAMEIMRRLEGLLINSGEKFMPTTSHGQEGFELGTVKRQGKRVLFQSRTKAAGLGTSGDCIILDEAMWLAPEAIGVLMPTMAARPNPQLWYAGSSVDQETHPKGYVFSGVRHRGIEGKSPRLCYMEWSPDEGDDRADPRTWAKVNPGMGFRLTREYVADEFDAMRHTPKMFDVMRLGIGDWPTLADTLKPPIDVDEWMQLASTAPRLVNARPRVIGVDRAPVSRLWSVAGAQYTHSGGAHVEIGMSLTGSPTEIVERLVDVVTDADPAALVIDSRSPAAVLKPLLIEAGIEPMMTNQSELAMACEGFLEAVLAGAPQFSHSGQQVLTNSVAAAVKNELPGGRFTWGGAPGGGSIVHVMAATLAHWGLLTYASPAAEVAAPLVGTQEKTPSRGADDDFDAMTAPF